MTKESVRNILATLLVVLATLLLAGGGYYLGRYRAGLGKNSALGKLQASLDLINTQYVDEVSSDSLVETLIPSLVSHLDPHSSYLTAEQRKKEREELEGYFYGIGVVFNSLKDTAIVIRTIPNGPSDLVGVRAGDRIVSVDGRSIEGEIPTDTIMSLLKGANESMVTLTLRDPSTNDLRTVKVKRGPVSTSKVGAKYMMSDSLGVIRLDGFSLSTYNDFMQAFAQLQQRGMKGLVLDLRDNPGGILESALRMVNEMLPKDKPVIYIEGAHYPREQYRSSGDGSLIGFPLYILINESSASAAEIVSGAMQDNDAAIVIGRRSFGKGLVQKVFEYPDGSSVHLTIARYYTPSGRCIQREYHTGDSDEYYSDWAKRFSSGELFSSDSIPTDSSKVYKTGLGRLVYGGGGIIPDIFIPQDSAKLTGYTMDVLRKGIPQKYAFLYADSHRAYLANIGDELKCYDFLRLQGLPWLMGNYAAREYNIPLRGYLISHDEDYISDLMAQSVIMYIYGDDAMARVSALRDPMISRAVDLFSQQIYSPMRLSSEE